jgi:hypothetical protein
VTTPPPYENPHSANSPYGYAVVPAPTKRPVRTWDLVVTIILLVLSGILAAIMSLFGFFLAMAGDSCGARDCNSDLIAVGLMVAFWVPLLGAVFIIGSWFIGAFIAAAGVPGSL